MSLLVSARVVARLAPVGSQSLTPVTVGSEFIRHQIRTLFGAVDIHFIEDGGEDVGGVCPCCAAAASVTSGRTWGIRRGQLLPRPAAIKIYRDMEESRRGPEQGDLREKGGRRKAGRGRGQRTLQERGTELRGHPGEAGRPRRVAVLDDVRKVASVQPTESQRPTLSVSASIEAFEDGVASASVQLDPGVFG